MAKYRKKPVIIDAYTFDEVFDLAHAHNQIIDAEHFRINDRLITYVPVSKKTIIPKTELEDTMKREVVVLTEEKFIIETLEGNVEMTPKDMLIIGVRGECYPCKADIFAETYEIESVL